MRRLPLLLVPMIVLAGCSGGEQSETEDTAMPDASSSTDPETETSPEPERGENSEPSASLGAENLTGPAPLNVTWLIDGSDVDDDALTWTLDADGDGVADGNGTEVPAELPFRYDAPGIYLAILNVTDGVATTSANVTVNVTDLAAATPIQTVAATYAFGAEGCYSWAAYDNAGSDPAAQGGGTLNETTRVEFNVDPLTMGRAYSAVFTFDQGYLFLEVAFYDAADDLLESNVNDSAAFGGATMTGTVPANAVKGILFACGGPTESSVVYTA